MTPNALQTSIGDPLFRAGVALIRDLVQLTYSQRGDLDTGLLCRLAERLLYLGFTQMHFVPCGAETHLDAVAPEFLGNLERGDVACPADRPVAYAYLETAFGGGGQ